VLSDWIYRIALLPTNIFRHFSGFVLVSRDSHTRIQHRYPARCACFYPFVGEKVYCRASINRVWCGSNLIGAAQLFDLLMECSTVVWCFPPNWRPISAAEAVVSCFTMYIATWRGKAIARVLCELSDPAHADEVLAYAFLNQVYRDTLSPATQ